METRKLYINGSWIVAESDRVIKVENPETHAIIACVPRSGDADVNKAVAAAKAAFETWQFAPLSERLEKMERVLAGMRRNRQRLIDTISAELGCPIHDRVRLPEKDRRRNAHRPVHSGNRKLYRDRQKLLLRRAPRHLRRPS